VTRYQGGGLYGQFHALFVPKAMDPEQLPEDLRERVAARAGGSDYRWYVAEAVAGGVFTAVNHQAGDAPVRRLHLAIWQYDPATDETAPDPLVEVSMPVEFGEPFGCRVVQASGDRATGTPAPGAAAGGWAWDHRVTNVTVIFDDGTQAGTRPVHGCWLLSSEVPADRWREIRAQDPQGKPMYGKIL